MQADFDFGLLYDMTAGDAQIVSNLLGVIKKNLNEFPAKIKELFEENKIDEVCKLAHKFKSSIAYLGFEEFSNNLSEIELSVEEEKTHNQISELIEGMVNYSEITLNEVEEELIRLEHME